MKRRILYFVNPISGTRGKENLIKKIEEKTTLQGIPFEIVYTNAKGDYQFLNDSVSFSFGLNYNSSPQILNYYNIIKNSYPKRGELMPYYYYLRNKSQIDINILNKFLDVLKRIEDGELDQHEGSFLVGSILKELYVDSALKKADKLNADEEPKPEPKKPEKSVSYKQFKKMNK